MWVIIVSYSLEVLVEIDVGRVVAAKTNKTQQSQTGSTTKTTCAMHHKSAMKAFLRAKM